MKIKTRLFKIVAVAQDLIAEDTKCYEILVISDSFTLTFLLS